MIDFTKPVQTRDGRAVRILCTDAGGDFPVVGLIKGRSESCWTAHHFAADGKLWLDEKNPEDLVNVPEKVVGYMLVQPCTEGSRIGYTSHLYNSPEAAKENAALNDQFCVKVEFTVGEGLDK